jgi:tRNA A37 methylthiotransferase MiaB
MKFYLETYGCTFNQGDSQIIAATLEKDGHELTQSAAHSDIIILNSCYDDKPYKILKFFLSPKQAFDSGMYG